MHSCKTKLLFTPVDGSLRRWTGEDSEAMLAAAGQAPWGTPPDRLEMRLEEAN